MYRLCGPTMRGPWPLAGVVYKNTPSSTQVFECIPFAFYLPLHQTCAVGVLSASCRGVLSSRRLVVPCACGDARAGRQGGAAVRDTYGYIGVASTPASVLRLRGGASDSCAIERANPQLGKCQRNKQQRQLAMRLLGAQRHPRRCASSKHIAKAHCPAWPPTSTEPSLCRSRAQCACPS